MLTPTIGACRVSWGKNDEPREHAEDSDDSRVEDLEGPVAVEAIVDGWVVGSDDESNNADLR